MRVDDGFVLREIAGDYVIIPTGKTVLDFNGMITVNEVGVSIWKMLQEETTFENIVKGILDEYDADEETVKADVQEFLDRIKGRDIEIEVYEKTSLNVYFLRWLHMYSRKITKSYQIF